MADCETGSDSMTFKDKKKFFEREIAQQTSQTPKETGRKFSFLQEHEVATLKSEEAKKMSTSTQSFEDATNSSNNLQTDAPIDIPTDFSRLISELTHRKSSSNCKSATERLFGTKSPPSSCTIKLHDRMSTSTEDKNDFIVTDKIDE